ncbi:hypothetical protein STEG23_031073, partial [Scotinomys teguina]
KILRAKRKQFIRSVGEVTIKGLLDELLEKEVLNQGEVEKITAVNATVMDKARDLCDSVIKKGPLASQILITYICSEDCFLAGILQLELSSPAENSIRTDDFQGGVPSSSETKQEQNKECGTFPGPSGTLKLCSLERVQKIKEENPLEIYPIMDTSTRTRLALIICNTEFEYLPRRDGADVDLREMKLLLQGLGYTVKEKENLTAQEMTEAVKEFAACPEHETSDSTFLVFMSHGIQEGICGKTYSDQVPDVLKVDTVFQMMNTLNCPSLKDKPKVIIIQACRGENRGIVLVKDSVGDTGKKFLVNGDFEDDGIKKAHIEKDFIAFCSSTPDKILRAKRKQFIRSVGEVTIKGLLDELLEKEVLNQGEVEKITAVNATVMDKARDLCDSVIKKGPLASQILITYICSEDCFLAGILQLELKTKQEQNKECGTFPGPSGTLKLCSLERVQKIKEENPLEIYPIMDTSTRTRLALIICNTEFEYLPRRDGADVDLREMKLLLQGLGYTVKEKENLTAQEMTEAVKEFAACPEHETSDSTFLVFMSHGIQEGICGKTYSDQVPDVLKVDTVFQMMNTLNCPSLKDKPKVIIIQACRGENEGIVLEKDSVGDTGKKFLVDGDFEDDGIKRAHIEKDFIAFCSSTPDNLSWRDVNGSLFIMELINHMKEYACSCDLEEIFRKSENIVVSRRSIAYQSTSPVDLDKEQENLLRWNLPVRQHHRYVSGKEMQTVSEITFTFIALYNQEAYTAMAGKRTNERDPIYKIKGFAKNVLDGVFDDLVEKNVLNGDELLRIGQGARFLLNNAENLAENIFEKTEMASKIFAGHIVNSKKQLRLRNLSDFHYDDEDGESQEISTASSPADSENGIKDRKDEEQTLSEKTSTFYLTESRIEKEDEEMEDNVGVALASHSIQTAPQGIQSTEAHDTLKLCPGDEFYKMKTKKANEIYPVMEKEGRTRLALIICNKKFDYLFDRDDAEVDILNMQELLQNLGYSVVLKENLTAQEMETELRQFADRPEHQSSDSTFLVFMSHGVLEGICGVKHRIKEPDILHDDTIFTIFNNSNCSSLRDKPKILIMQACRGSHNGIVWVSTRTGIATADTDEERVLSSEWNSSVTKAHVEKDFIAFKSSTPHNISWKLSKNGSLFISKLIDCFKKYCWCCHLEEIFRK